MLSYRCDDNAMLSLPPVSLSPFFFSLLPLGCPGSEQAGGFCLALTVDQGLLMVVRAPLRSTALVTLASDLHSCTDPIVFMLAVINVFILLIYLLFFLFFFFLKKKFYLDCYIVRMYSL